MEGQPSVFLTAGEQPSRSQGSVTPSGGAGGGAGAGPASKRGAGADASAAASVESVTAGVTSLAGMSSSSGGISGSTSGTKRTRSSSADGSHRGIAEAVLMVQKGKMPKLDPLEDQVKAEYAHYREDITRRALHILTDELPRRISSFLKVVDVNAPPGTLLVCDDLASPPVQQELLSDEQLKKLRRFAAVAAADTDQGRSATQSEEEEEEQVTTAVTGAAAQKDISLGILKEKTRKRLDEKEDSESCPQEQEKGEEVNFTGVSTAEIDVLSAQESEQLTKWLEAKVNELFSPYTKSYLLSQQENLLSSAQASVAAPHPTGCHTKRDSSAASCNSGGNSSSSRLSSSSSSSDSRSRSSSSSGNKDDNNSSSSRSGNDDDNNNNNRSSSSSSGKDNTSPSINSSSNSSSSSSLNNNDENNSNNSTKRRSSSSSDNNSGDHSVERIECSKNETSKLSSANDGNLFVVRATTAEKKEEKEKKEKEDEKETEEDKKEEEADAVGGKKQKTTCQQLAEQAAFVKREAVAMRELLNAVKIFMQLHVPRIEDGNNFGVAIQEEAINLLNRVEESAFNLYDTVMKYFLARAKLCSKLIKYPNVMDYQMAIVELDRKEWIHLKITKLDLRNNYIMLYDLICKNWQNVVAPKGRHYTTSQASLMY